MRFQLNDGTWQQLPSIRAHVGISEVTVSPNGKVAASSGWEDKTIKIWNTTGSLLFLFTGV